MTNHDDQDILRNSLSEASHGLMNFLPALRNGEAIVVGEGVSMPMRICFSPLPDEYHPRSSTALFTRAWSADWTTAPRSTKPSSAGAAACATPPDACAPLVGAVICILSGAALRSPGRPLPVETG